MSNESSVLKFDCMLSSILNSITFEFIPQCDWDDRGVMLVRYGNVKFPLTENQACQLKQRIDLHIQDHEGTNTLPEVLTYEKAKESLRKKYEDITTEIIQTVNEAILNDLEGKTIIVECSPYWKKISLDHAVELISKHWSTEYLKRNDELFIVIEERSL